MAQRTIARQRVDAVPSPGESETSRPLSGLRILVVEDIGMVAMALKSMAEELGCAVVAIAARLAEATAIVERGGLDGVLLDLNLDGEFSYPLAATLRSMGIPFIVMSGYDPALRDPSVVGVPWMQKPFDRQTLTVLMQTVFAPRSSREGQFDEVAGGIPASTKTRGEIESEVCRGMCGFALEYLGRGPRDIEAHLIGELLVVRLQGVLTAADRHLAQSSRPKDGRDLIKAVRRALIEGARKQVDSMVQLVTGVQVRSLHHDISTTTGDEVVVFTLQQSPTVRVPKSR